MTDQTAPQHWIQEPLPPSWDNLADFALSTFAVPKELSPSGGSFSSLYSTLKMFEAIEDARRRLILSRAF